MSHSPTNKRVQQMQNVQIEGLELFKKKNADYGDSFANFGPVGVIVRMGDKINRLSSVTKNGVHLVDNESVRDTLIDLHNYAAMAIMLLDEKKKHKTRVEQLKEQEKRPQDTAYLCKVDKMALAKKNQIKIEAPYPASGYAHRG
tara:strand:+ start:701 stop:1132 length:432 start_codon:yes stop_codon:yes gene_type:complete